MASITVRVGAARDASLSTVFAPLEAAAKKARSRVATESAATGAALAKGTKAGVDKAEAAFAELAKEIAGEGKSMMTPATKAVDDFAKEARASFANTKRDFDAMARSVSKDMDKLESKKGSTGPKNFGGRLRDQAKEEARVAKQVGKTALNFGKRVGGAVLSGEGVDYDLSSLTRKNVDLETGATKVANSGYMPGQAGPNGQRQDAGAIAAQVMQVSKATAIDTSQGIDALDKFVAKTGDLATGRDMLLQLAQLSKATGADLSDMADAAGDVANNLGDVPNKGQATVDVLKLVSAQGKEGAVEIKDLASQMAKVAAAAGQFEGDKSANIAQFSALAQLTRAKGGAASATQAATSVSAFQGTFSKGARLDAFKAMGVNVSGKNGRTRDAEDVILDSIQAAATKNGGMKNFDRTMGTMFADRGARRVTKGFESTFQDNYAKAQGTEQQRVTQAIAETRAEFDKLKLSTMDDRQVTESLATAMGTAGSRATELSLQMQEGATQVQKAVDTVLYPAIANAARYFSIFNGDQGAKQNSAAVGAGVEGTNVTAIADRAMQTGTISPDDLATITKAKADQDAALEQQKAAAQKPGAASGAFQSWLAGADDTPLGQGVNAIDRFAGGTGNLGKESADAMERNRASAQLNVDKLSISQDRTNEILTDIASHLKDGTLKMSDPSAPNAPRIDQSGRTPGVTGAPRR